MEDLKLNSNFSVHLDDRNDLATVSDREAFEQSVVMMLTDFMYNTLPGLYQSNTIEEKIELQVTRVAREHNNLDALEAIDINEKLGEADTYEVRIIYSDEGVEDFSEDVTAQ
jgi:hypothetical protein